MKRWIAIVAAVLIAGCATAQQPARNAQLFNDRLFAAPTERVNAEDVFALTPDMQHYVRTKILDDSHQKGPQQALFDALYVQGELKLEYDATATRNAAQTFATRSGNCLSLAIMTAAMAKELGLSVYYQRVFVDEMWSRSGELYFSTGHINLTLEKRVPKLQGYDTSQTYTVDFLPPEHIAGARSKPIQERTVVAMYMNNRAAEALARGDVNNAYWWAREAVIQDPKYVAAYNTLGVVYERHGNPQLAQAVLSEALDIDSKNTLVLFNLAQTLRELGRKAEADVLTARLEQLQPDQPYHFFHLGKDAIEKGDFKTARDMFAKEVKRDPYNSEFQFWLASAYYRLGELAEADRHLKLAQENSTTREDRDLYAAKRSRLKALMPN